MEMSSVSLNKVPFGSKGSKQSFILKKIILVNPLERQSEQVKQQTMKHSFFS